jgi:clathrin heavy chain
MVTAAVSGDTSVAEELMSYFVDIGNKDCFAATLYVCFDLLRPDVVAEMVSSFALSYTATSHVTFCTSPGDMA